MSFERHHQTCCFIYAEEANPHYKARIVRLLECMNGDNIKVDLLTVMPDGKIFAGSPFEAELASGEANPSGSTPGEFAKDFEYNLVLQCSPSTLVPTMTAITADEQAAPEGLPVSEANETPPSVATDVWALSDEAPDPNDYVEDDEDEEF